MTAEKKTAENPPPRMNNQHSSDVRRGHQMNPLYIKRDQTPRGLLLRGMWVALSAGPRIDMSDVLVLIQQSYLSLTAWARRVSRI